MNLLASFLLMTILLGGNESPNENSVRMLLFTSDNCPACQTVKPGVEHLLDKGYPIQVVNISEQPESAERFVITQVPTFVLIRDGLELDRKAGALSPEEIAHQINAATPATNRNPLIRETATQEGVSYDGTSSAVYNEPPGFSESAIEATTGHTVVSNGSIAEPSHDNLTAPVNASPQAAYASTAPLTGVDGKPIDTSKSVEIVTSIEKRAHQATVRFRIEDDEGTNHGSGTIIHIHDQEALVLTCGHIFRESKGTGRIFADVGFPNRQHTVRGKLLAYDADAHDIALVVIQLEIPVEAVPLANSAMRPHAGNDLYSIGCDRGADPTMRRGKMKRISRYSGVTKYDVSNRPIDGRSGGGLYNAKGELVGVCNAADVNADEGIYAGLKTIHWQLSDAGLSDVMTIPSRGPKELELELEQLVSSDSTYGGNRATSPGRTAGQAFNEVIQKSAAVDDLVPVTRAIEDAQGDVEMIIIVRSKQNPEQTNSFVLENPDPELIRMVASERVRDESGSSIERTASTPATAGDVR